MILTINSGSSSIKFALYKPGDCPEKFCYGQLTRVGLPGTGFTVNSETKLLPVKVTTYQGAIDFLIGWLEKNILFTDVNAIGHRIVMHTDEEMMIAKLVYDMVPQQ